MSSANFLFLLLMVVGPLVSLSASNWMICWAGLELSFLGLIPMLFISNKFMSLNKESGLKYFCVQALGSALLFVSGLMYFSGLGDSSSVVVMLLILSLCIKLGIFPGHFWVPTVIAGLEWFSSFLILSVQKVPPLALLVKVLGGLDGKLQEVCLLLAAVSAVVGGLIGNNQTEVRAMIGASSITHTGWLMLGSLSGSLWVYFLLYCFVLGFTLIFLWEGVAAACCLSLLSLSGLPPFLMFIGKWSVVKGAIELGTSAFFLGLFLFGAFLSLIFYLKFSYSFYLTLKENSSLVWGHSFVSFVMLNFLGAFFLVIL